MNYNVPLEKLVLKFETKQFNSSNENANYVNEGSADFEYIYTLAEEELKEEKYGQQKNSGVPK
jgi:hypothetical protein